MTRDRSAESGFLLADMLVTLTVSALVLVGLTGLSGTLLRTADRSVAAIEAADDLGRTMTSVAHLLRAAARARFSGREPQPFIFNGDTQRLMFARTGTTASGARGLEVLAFRSQDDGTLWRTDATLPPMAETVADLPFRPARVSHRGAEHLRFAYLGSGDADAPAGWVPLWPIGMHMPQAVAIEALDASGRRVLARMEVSIMADTDLGCLTGGFCGRGLDAAAPMRATHLGGVDAPGQMSFPAGAGR